MKNKTLAALLLASSLFTACQKEAALEDPNALPGGPPPAAGLLTRAVEVDGIDSTIILYAYDASGRLSNISASGTSASSLTYAIKRSPAGIITQTIVKSDDLIAIGIDSLVTNFFYNAAAARYTYSRNDVDLGGILLSDSSVFAYNAGNIGAITSYAKVPLSGYAPSSRTDYTYANGNLASEKEYDYNTATAAWALSLTTNYTHDAKTSALTLGMEGIVLGLSTTFSNNNVTLEEIIDPSSGTTTYSSTFLYNSANKPSSGSRMENPGGYTYTLRFYYQ